MKKSLLIVAALFAAITLNAREITLEPSAAVSVAYDNCSATPTVSGSDLNVAYTAGEWQWAGVEFPLDNLDVTSIDFEYKGVTEAWTSFVVYLRADDGARWYDDADDFSMSQADWFAKKSYFPTKLMWDASEYALGTRPFTAIGFIANPGVQTTGTFSLRNIKLTVSGEETALENVSQEGKTMKVIRNGQVLFIRDDKNFNALGAEVK